MWYDLKFMLLQFDEHKKYWEKKGKIKSIKTLFMTMSKKSSTCY